MNDESDRQKIVKTNNYNENVNIKIKTDRS